MTQVMYVCDCCAENNPEGCGHYDREDLILIDEISLCKECFDDIDMASGYLDGVQLLGWGDYSHPAKVSETSEEDFQTGVTAWVIKCLGRESVQDTHTRNFRFLEEALELVQAHECTALEAHMLVDYVYGRPQGDVNQEVGGVMLTLAALCTSHGIEMVIEGERELARVNTPELIAKVRAKQATKPNHSPLPGSADS